jgi:DNA repair exonuclease SbcCD ATPase subunit
LLGSLNESALQETRDNIIAQQSALSDNVSRLNNSIEMLFSSKENLLKERTLIVDEENKQLYDLHRDFQLRTERLNETKSKLTAELSVAKNQLNAIKNIKDVCPTCGQKLPDVHKPDTSELEVSINITQDNLQDVISQIAEFEKEYDSDYKLVKSTFLNKKASIDTDYNNVCKTYDSQRAQKQQEEHQLSSLNSELSKVEVQLAQLQATIDNCNKIIRDNNETLLSIADELMYNNMQKDLTQSHLEVVNKFDTALKRDFRGYLLSTVIAYIEQRAKYYSKIIFDTENIVFCLDGNNIDINYMSRAYENLSGGEKQKIDLIIQFSIRDMLSTHLGFTSNILVLDEVFDSLDSIGCTKVVDMIASVSDIRNIFIVTHRKDLSIPSDKELVVVKSSAGISEIQ